MVLGTVRSYARANQILRSGPLVLAVSGGADSTALCLILRELKEEFGLVLHVAHFDHRARPRAAAADAAFVAELANHIGATLRVGRADAPPKSEDDARVARYEFLRRVARDRGATAIATGHTRDDQAETVLLHMVRGSGLAGLAGMRPERDGIIRPLLTISRADTQAICKAARITPRDDATNRSLRFARNRIRLRVLPELAKLNPDVTAAIARLADAAGGVADIATVHAAAALKDATREEAARDSAGDEAPRNEVVVIDRLPSDDTARTNALALWWELRTGRQLAARQRSALARLAASAVGSRALDLPGGRALREYATLRVTNTDENAPRDRSQNGPLTLESGRSGEWHGWSIALDIDMGGDADVGRVDAQRVVIRGRRPGDRMAGPRGAKVQDIFTNAKVPARERDVWPLVTIEQQIVWIPGLTAPPRSGRSAVRALRMGEDSLGMTLGNRQQVASLREQRPRGTERGRPRT